MPKKTKSPADYVRSAEYPLTENEKNNLLAFWRTCKGSLEKIVAQELIAYALQAKGETKVYLEGLEKINRFLESLEYEYENELEEIKIKQTQKE